MIRTCPGRLSSAAIAALLALAAGPTRAHAASPAGGQAAIDVAAGMPSNIQGVVELETDSPADSSVRMGEDLASLVGDGATRRVLPIVGSNALQNITDLMRLRGIDVAILPLDAMDYVRQQNLYPNIGSITYVAKLYQEEFHLLVRRNISSIADLANQKVNIDPGNGGTAITAGRIFHDLKIPVVPTTDASEVALKKLRDGEIAALAFVGGKPVPFLRRLTAEDGLHLLSVPVHDPLYRATELTAQDYPGLVPPNATIDTVSVGMALFVAPLSPTSERYKNVARVVNTFFTQFATLQQPGHDPKWQQVNLDDTLPGWRRFPPAEEWIRRNSAVASTDPQALKAAFYRFLDARASAAGEHKLSASEKEQLFQQYQSWEHNQPGEQRAR
jgi:TRAP-type uncharacterized transport system substrate-binding protein